MSGREIPAVEIPQKDPGLFWSGGAQSGRAGRTAYPHTPEKETIQMWSGDLQGGGV